MPVKAKAVPRRTAMAMVADYLNDRKVRWTADPFDGSVGVGPLYRSPLVRMPPIERPRNGMPNVMVFEGWYDHNCGVDGVQYGAGLGLWLLSGRASVSPYQAGWIQALGERGYKTSVVSTSKAAIEFFETYLFKRIGHLLRKEAVQEPVPEEEAP